MTASHKLQGRWRSFTIDDPTQIAQPDGEMYLRMPPNGVVSPGSNHEGKVLTGNATVTAGVQILVLNQDDLRVYNGKLLSEDDTNGQKSFVIVGRYIDPLPSPLDARARENDIALDEGQNQGDWILIKP